MPKRTSTFLPAALSLGILAGACTGAPQPPPAEPIEVTPSAGRAGRYLEARSTAWLTSAPDIANVRCAMSCHTTFPFLIVRGALPAPLPVGDATRNAFEVRVAQATASTAVPFYGSDASIKVKQSHATEAVLNATALALDDLGTGSPIRDTTKAALDRMWSLQRDDGAWDWLEFGLEPWERGDDWGAAMAALVAGSIPTRTTTMQAMGTSKITGYIQKRLADTPPMALHDRVAVLWASGHLEGLLRPEQAGAIRSDLVATQRPDGGFSLGSWGRGQRAQAESGVSDGYATSLALLALCAGAPEHGATRRGLDWLAKNQRDDGSWPGRSMNEDSAQHHGYMTDAATAYAILALARCPRE